MKKLTGSTLSTLILLFAATQAALAGTAPAPTGGAVAAPVMDDIGIAALSLLLAVVSIRALRSRFRDKQ